MAENGEIGPEEENPNEEVEEKVEEDKLDHEIDKEEEKQPEEAKKEYEEEDEDDEIPEYANEQNKQLHEIIKEKKRLKKECAAKYEEKTDRVKIIKDHLKNVNAELLHTQALVDEKNKEIEGEDHLKQLAERQIGRLQSEMQKEEKKKIQMQERLNDIQNEIFKGNEKMDKLKLQMNWHQEDLEQWALAARQKEDDNVTLEKYKRADDAKLKDLNLTIEKLTIETGRKERELEKEVTETKAAQIELDKTAEEFRKNHEERSQLFNQWKEVQENIIRRDQALLEEGDVLARIKKEIAERKKDCEDKKKILTKAKLENKNSEALNLVHERKIIDDRANNKKIDEQINNLEAEVEIYKNQLSANATILSQRKAECLKLLEEQMRKKQRLNKAEKKYSALVSKKENEESLSKDFETSRKEAEEYFKVKEKERIENDNEIRIQKEILFKNTQELFKFREKMANLYGEIQGVQAACRNLQAHITKLNQEFQKQQELLYNAEFQIQVIERKVARARGDRSLEEKRDLETELKDVETKLKKIEGDHKLITNSMKNLEEERRTLLRKLSQAESEQKKLKSLKNELRLENDMTYQDLNKIVKLKEDALVQHDCMKLEIKKLKDILAGATDKVYNLENRKQQLEMSMQEREREIGVHRDILIAEHKAAEEERHKLAIEVADRKNKVKNVKIKYESLVQKNKSISGEVETVSEHSQAFYIIKAAQEREELQRKGDELQAKITKSEKELKSLENTLSNLQARNHKFRDQFLNKGVKKDDFVLKESLEDQCRAATENLYKKEKDLQKHEKEYEEDLRRFKEIENKQFNEIQVQLKKIDDESKSQENKFERAEKLFNSKQKNISSAKIDISISNPHIVQAYYDIENNKNKSLISTVQILCAEFPELANPLSVLLKEKQILIPSKPPSSIDIKSQMSTSSEKKK